MTNLLLFLGLLLPLRPLLVPWLTSHVLLCLALTAFSCFYLILYVQTDCEALQVCTEVTDYKTFDPKVYLISDKYNDRTWSQIRIGGDRSLDRNESKCVGSHQAACTVLLGYSSSIVAAIILLTYLIYLVQVNMLFILFNEKKINHKCSHSVLSLLYLSPEVTKRDSTKGDTL